MNEVLYAKCLAAVAPRENIKMGFKPGGTKEGFMKRDANRASIMANGRIMTAEEKRDKRRAKILLILPLTCTEISNKLRLNRDLIKRDLSAMASNGQVTVERKIIGGISRPIYHRAN
jgi:hypothetical protein